MHLLPKMKKIGVPLLKKVKLLSFLSILPCLAFPDAEPLKVFILCGQSNMEGHAKISTFEAMKTDPDTKLIYERMVDESGAPVVCDDVWISYLTGEGGRMGEGIGKLGAGYGARRAPSEKGEKIGPEFTFGIYAREALQEPILIIKTAWGGKSIHTDFRPPAAGPYQFNDSEIENFKKRGKDLKVMKAEKEKQTGRYYRLMIDHVKAVLSNPKRIYPDYQERRGYELAGFVWFQGWNDMVAGGTYPNRDRPGGYDEYTDCLAHLIRDVRKDLQAPKMKFVIGVMGVGGPLEKYLDRRYVSTHGNFREAMAAPASMPEFKDNVIAVRTARFWDMRLQAWEDNQDKVRRMEGFLKSKHREHPNHDGRMSSAEQRQFLEKYRKELISEEEQAYAQMARSNGAYHYYGSAKTMARIGKAFAEALVGR